MLWGNKRYHTLNYYYRKIFNEKVFKVALDGGFSCPNRDGTISYGGCIYCSAGGSGDFAGDKNKVLKQQFDEVREKMHKKWPQAKYIGYFQAFTSTYGPADELKRMYQTILNEEGVVGISISTRPDCLSEEVLEVLEGISKETALWVELGLQTIHEETLKTINRGHDYQTFLEAVNKLKERNIDIIVHIILNLPGESKEEMIETAKAVANMPVQGIKIHMLHLLKDTPMIKLYEEGQLYFMKKQEYVELIVDILEILPSEMVIHRLTGDGPPKLLIEPLWTLKKWEVLNAIDQELKDRDSWQGKFYIDESL